MTKFTMWKKWKKWSNNYIQTTCASSYHEENICKVSKRSAQNWKRSCAHKKYPLSIYRGEKWLSSQCWKMTKIVLTIIFKPHAHLHTWRKHMQSFKRIGRVQNCKWSCAHKTTRVNVDGKTNRRTDERTGTCTPVGQLRQERQQWAYQHDKTLYTSHKEQPQCHTKNKQH